MSNLRNRPCPCGSGKKNKKCCGANLSGNLKRLTPAVRGLVQTSRDGRWEQNQDNPFLRDGRIPTDPMEFGPLRRKGGISFSRLAWFIERYVPSSVSGKGIIGLAVGAEGARSLVNENTVLERGSDDSMTLFVASL
jgi:hypothetical protein